MYAAEPTKTMCPNEMIPVLPEKICRPTAITTLTRNVVTFSWKPELPNAEAYAVTTSSRPPSSPTPPLRRPSRRRAHAGAVTHAPR